MFNSSSSIVHFLYYFTCLVQHMNQLLCINQFLVIGAPLHLWTFLNMMFLKSLVGINFLLYRSPIIDSILDLSPLFLYDSTCSDIIHSIRVLVIFPPCVKFAWANIIYHTSPDNVPPVDPLISSYVPMVINQKSPFLLNLELTTHHIHAESFSWVVYYLHPTARHVRLSHCGFLIFLSLSLSFHHILQLLISACLLLSKKLISGSTRLSFPASNHTSRSFDAMYHLTAW